MTSTLEIPVRQNADGVLLVGSSRVTLDTVVTAFQLGASAEEIALRYPALQLADVYSTIGYYLGHQAEIEAYLTRRRKDAGAVRQENETRFSPDGIRSRLLARRATDHS